MEQREDYKIPRGKRRVENVCILGLVIMSVCAILAAIFHVAGMETFVFGRTEIKHSVETISAIIIILTSWRVYLRRRLAWISTIALLILGIIIDFYSLNHPLHILLLVVESIALVILLVCHRDFCRFSRRGKIKELTVREKEKVIYLVKKYGQNPGSYLALEGDKTLYFGESVEGVIPYGIIGDVIVINGDPICAPEDFESLLTEFKKFCRDNIYSSVFLSVTDKYLSVYKKLGYGTVKCGEEAEFDVQNYSLKGGKVAKVRAEINHAVKDGILVCEYKPLEEEDMIVEAQFRIITQEWLAEKKSGELVFTLGNVGFDDPLDKRYFYACDEDGWIFGFIVFIPYAGMTGYMADVTRRAKDAPRGVMEMIMYQAMLQFKAEGIQKMSMGLAPLARMDEGEKKDDLTSKLLAYVYEHLNGVYGFKDLYHAKQKYNPAVWNPGYFAFDPKIITPDMAFAIVAIQNPRGIWDYFKGYLQDLRKARKEKKQEAKTEKA